MTRFRFVGTGFLVFLMLSISPALAVSTSGVSYEFNVDGNREGWGRSHSVSPLTVSGGTLLCKVVGEDPFFESPDFSVNAAENPVVLIRMKVSASGMCQIYWETAAEPRMDEEKVRVFQSGAADEWELHILNMAEHPKWFGVVTQLRIDPPESAGQIEVDFVRVCSMADIPAILSIESFTTTDQVALETGQLFNVSARIRNTGGQSAINVTASLTIPAGLVLQWPAVQTVPALAVGDSIDLIWTLSSTGEVGGALLLSVTADLHTPLSASTRVIPPNPNCEKGSSYTNSKTSLWIKRHIVAGDVSSDCFILAIGYADFDGDGITDIVMAPGNSRSHTPIHVYKGLSSGQFQEATTQFISGEIPGCVHPRKLLIADFNSDNRPDIYITDHGIDQPPYPGHHNVLLLSNTAGQLEYKKDHEDLVGFNHGATAADFDNDGDVDIFVTGLYGILKNDGIGHFTLDSNAIFFANLGYTTEFIDVDKDGYIDLLVGGHEFEATPTRIYWGNSLAVFSDSRVTVLPLVQQNETIVDFDVEDLNNDGLKDVVVTRTGGPFAFYSGFYIQVIMQKSARIFADESIDRIIYDFKAWVGRKYGWIDWVRLVDFDQNGSPDIVVDDAILNLRWKNIGQGFFTLARTLGVAKIIVKDMNGNLLTDASVSTASQPPGQTTLAGKTDSNGSSIFKDIKIGNYTFISFLSGYEPGTIQFKVESEKTLETAILLDVSPGSLKVSVKDSTGTVLSGATVSSTKQPSGQTVLSGVTGADGVVTFTGLAPGNYTVHVLKSGYLSGSAQGSVALGGKSEVNAIIKALPSSGITGFPYVSIIIGVLISATWLWLYTHRLRAPQPYLPNPTQTTPL